MMHTESIYTLSQHCTIIYKALACYMQHALGLMSAVQNEFSDKADRSMKAMT